MVKDDGDGYHCGKHGGGHCDGHGEGDVMVVMVSDLMSFVLQQLP